MGILNFYLRIGNLRLLGVFLRPFMIRNHDTFFYFWNGLGNLVYRFLGGSPKITMKMGDPSTWCDFHCLLLFFFHIMIARLMMFSL